jgi:hypothetical protein
LLLYKNDAQRAREHSKAFAGELKPEVKTVSFEDGNREKNKGKRTDLGRLFGSNRAKRPGFEAKNRDFPVIFRGQISRCGRIWAVYFLSGVDFKRVRNNLQRFRKNLYPLGV